MNAQQFEEMLVLLQDPAVADLWRRKYVPEANVFLHQSSALRALDPSVQSPLVEAAFDAYLAAADADQAASADPFTVTMSVATQEALDRLRVMVSLKLMVGSVAAAKAKVRAKCSSIPASRRHDVD